MKLDDQNKSSRVLQARAEKYSQELQTQTYENTVDVILFRCNQTEYAMPLHLLAEVRKFFDYTNLPMTPEHILGVTNIRSRIVGIYDLNKYLGSEYDTTDPPETVSLSNEMNNQRFLIVGHGAANHIALLVDHVYGTESVISEQCNQKPISMEKHSFVRGIDRQGRIHLDPERMPDEHTFYQA